MRKQCILATYRLPPIPLHPRVASSSRQIRRIFHFQNTAYCDHSLTTAFHSIIPSLSQNYARLSYFFTGGGVIHRHIWLVGIQHNA